MQLHTFGKIRELPRTFKTLNAKTNAGFSSQSNKTKGKTQKVKKRCIFLPHLIAPIFFRAHFHARLRLAWKPGLLCGSPSYAAPLPSGNRFAPSASLAQEHTKPPSILSVLLTSSDNMCRIHNFDTPAVNYVDSIDNF